MNGREPFPFLVVRPVQDDDLPQIVATLRRLSRESFYRRFFTLTPDPTRLVARHLALVDHRDHEAMVVLADGVIVAIAQWDRSSGRDTEAEVAVTVEDAWQRRGLGRALVRMVAADAHAHGIETLRADVLSENVPALHFAARNRPTARIAEGPETHFSFSLARRPAA